MATLATMNRPAASTLARLALGATMAVAGVGHLTTQREEFQAQVPAWFPVDEDLTVLASGAIEIGLGVAFVALPRRRQLVGGLLAAFFQPILVLWALWGGGWLNRRRER